MPGLTRIGPCPRIKKTLQDLNLAGFCVMVHPPGIEPGRTCVRGILSPLRLPIPPWMRICVGVNGGSGEIRTHG